MSDGILDMAFNMFGSPKKKHHAKKPSKTSVRWLVKHGMKEAAFKNKSNANRFASAWKKKGYAISGFKSSGPVVEGGFKRNAYYVIAKKV